MSKRTLKLGVGLLAVLALVVILFSGHVPLSSQHDEVGPPPGRGETWPPSGGEPTVYGGREKTVLHQPKHNWQSRGSLPGNEESDSERNPLTSTLRASPSASGNEFDILSRRIDACLDSANLTLYFKSTGYYDRAQKDAEGLLRTLREVIPVFEAPYAAPCWSTSFYASWKTSKLARSKSNYFSSSNVSGHIGDFHFVYSAPENMLQFRLLKIVLGTHWSNVHHHKIVEESFACLPKIFLLGYPKCGSTYLYCLLRKILKLALSVSEYCEVVKEPHWWVVPGPKSRVQPPTRDFLSIYLLNFHTGARLMKRNRNPVVTIDASPNLMCQWPRYSKEETIENYCILPSLLPIVLPDSKYFVVMRSPVTMLYSAFWFSCTMTGHVLEMEMYKGPSVFHERVTTKISLFRECRNCGQPLDVCADLVTADLFSPEFPSCGRIRLEMGLYYLHARKWLSVVPRERIHFFTLEELVAQELRDTVGVIVDFLQLPHPHSLPTDELQCRENTQEKIDYRHDPRLMMREDTKKILEDFYQPYNQMLADLLGDDKFLW